MTLHGVKSERIIIWEEAGLHIERLETAGEVGWLIQYGCRWRGERGRVPERNADELHLWRDKSAGGSPDVEDVLRQ